MNYGAAGVQNIRHITFTFFFRRAEQRLRKTAYNPCWVLQIQQIGAYTIFSHRPDPVGQQDPAGPGFNGRTTVADLDELPRILRPLQDFGILPKMDIVRRHDEYVFPVLTGDHHVFPVNFSWKKGHPFILHRLAVEGIDFEVNKILCFKQHRQDIETIVSSVGRVICGLPVRIAKPHEPGILYPPAFVFRHRENNPLRYPPVPSEL